MSSYTSTEWNFFFGFSLHDAIVLTAVPPLPVKFWPHLSLGISSGTHLFSMWTQQKGAEILMDGQHLLGRSSDAFPIVLHMDMAQLYNPVLPWNIVFGSSNSVWGTGDVTIATYSPIFGSAKSDLGCSPFSNQGVTVNLSCNNPVSFVLDFTVMWGTLRCGFTTADFLACLIDIALEIVMDVVSKYGFKILGKLGKAGKAGFKKAAAKTSSYMAERAAKKVAKEAAAELAKKAAKEAGEEVAETFASKLGRTLSEGFQSCISKLRKPVAANVDEVAQPSLLSRAWTSVKEGTTELIEGVTDSVTWKQIMSVPAVKKAAEQRYLLNRQFFRYIVVAKGFKYAKKAVNMGIDLSNVGTDQDQDQASANYQFFFWKLGARDDIYGDEEGESTSGSAGSLTSTRFDWVDDDAQTSARTARFDWVGDDDDETSTVDDRFDWADALMAEDEATA